MAILPDPSTADDDLPPLPPLLLALLIPWWTILITWLTALVERRLLARCRTHPLVRLAAVFDCDPVVQACAAFHHHAGPGAPVQFPVRLLVRAELLRAWYGALSDRQLEHRLTTDVLARWFVGLPLLAPPPDHTTLNRFHAWLMTHQPAALFDHVLATLDRLDPESSAAPQIVDTTALRSPAAPVSPRVLLARCTGRLAQWWIAHAPPSVQAALPPIDLGPLCRPVGWLPPAARPAALAATAALADRIISALTAALPALPAARRTVAAGQLATLHHILTSECQQDATGHWSARPHDQKGAFRPGSPTDREATFRDHGRTPPVLGYNAAIATTHTRIRSAVVVTGCTPDSDTLLPLLQQQQARGDPLPPHVIGDQAFGWGKLRAQVAAATDGQTMVVAHTPIVGSHGAPRYGPADFVLSSDERTCRCPNGVVSTRRYDHGEADGWQFRFTATACADCPLWAQCRDPQANPRGHRAVFISAYHGTVRTAAAFNRTAWGRWLLKKRWRVEPTQAWVVRYAGGRRARRVGRAAAQGHLWQACAVVNLRRWLARLVAGTAPPPQDGGSVRPLAGRWA